MDSRTFASGMQNTRTVQCSKTVIDTLCVEDYGFHVSNLLTFSNLTEPFMSELTFSNELYIIAKVYSHFFKSQTHPQTILHPQMCLQFYNRVVMQSFDMSVQCSWMLEVKCFAQEHTDVITAGRTKKESFLSGSARQSEPDWSFHLAPSQFHPC